MPKRRQPKRTHDDKDHEKRILRANERTIAALNTSLAQDKIVLTMGMDIHLNMRVDRTTGQQISCDIFLDFVDNERLGYLATKLRPFQLSSESIYYKDVITTLDHFANPGQKEAISQLLSLWEMCSHDRMQTYIAHPSGDDIFPEGLGDTAIADRVLYSQLVHADDASHITEHISADWQLWSLASVVGDWTAVVAHQQNIMHSVRPDLVPELTKWAGNSKTIFRRFGIANG